MDCEAGTDDGFRGDGAYCWGCFGVGVPDVLLWGKVEKVEFGVEGCAVH